MLENKSIIERELSRLTLIQRRLLYVTTNPPTQSIYSQNFITQTKLSIGSIQNGIKNLLEMDYLYKNNDVYYEILDPLINSVLTH